MKLEIWITLATFAATLGLSTAWFLTQIRNTMVRLKEETYEYRNLANAAEAQMNADREVRTLRQHNDELTEERVHLLAKINSMEEDYAELKQSTHKDNAYLCKQLDEAREYKDDYERVCRQFAEHKELTEQDFNGQKHREDQLIKDNEGLKRKNESLRFTLQDERVKVQQLTKDNETLKNKLFCKTDSNKTLRRHIEKLKEEKKELTSKLKDELTDTREELATTRLQLEHEQRASTKLHEMLNDWEEIDDDTDLTPNIPNYGKHAFWHKNKALGYGQPHWHTISAACRAHFETLTKKAHANKKISNKEIIKRYNLAQRGINTVQAGRKK